MPWSKITGRVSLRASGGAARYFAVALAGNGPVLAMDDTLLKQAVRLTVPAGEAASADLRAITQAVY